MVGDFIFSIFGQYDAIFELAGRASSILSIGYLTLGLYNGRHPSLKLPVAVFLGSKLIYSE